MISKKKPISIVAIIAATIIFVASSTLTNPVLAQSTGGSSSTSSDYKKFQKCLSDAESNGAATEQQVRDCFKSVYGSSSGDNTGSGGKSDNNKPDTNKAGS